MIYINVGEMCFIPMNVRNELFIGVRQLRWQHLSPVVSTFSTSIRLLSSFFIKHSLPLSLAFCPLSLFSFCGTPSRFLISGLSLRFSSCNQKFFAVRNIHYPVNTSSDHFHTDAVVPSSDHCRTQGVLPPSGHYSRFKIFIHSNHLPWYIEDHKISINS